MINLAGLRYRDALADRGGPIARIATSDFPVENRRLFQANAYMRPELFGSRYKRAVYSDAAGTGTHESPMVARFMAISEAMERWAYQETALSKDRAKFGFDVDPMSNGMAAFPGLFARQARRKAYLEAVERFSMTAWWEGLLSAVERPTEWPGIQAAVISSGGPEVVVILHKRTPDGHFAYGHAADETFLGACRKAVVELARHQYVIRSYLLARSCGCSVIESPTELLERRSVFFASVEGHIRFLRRLRDMKRGVALRRRVVYDGKIPGPWERYAHVWRVALQPVSDQYLQNREDYFLW